ncbi:MAG: holo-ACP synthase [Thermoproteota archaeon]
MCLGVSQENLIIRIGVDVISINRIKRAVEKGGERFLHRVFSERELEYCFGSGFPYEKLAGRFAAKEAVFKALGHASRRHLGWKGVEIEDDGSGIKVALNEVLFKLLEEKGAKNILLSLSHDRTSDVAIAVAILLG